MEFQKALEKFRQLLTAQYVITEAENLAASATATYPTDQKVLAIIQPSTKEEVQQCVLIANEYGLPVYPISKGRNWGYGSKVPVKDGSIIMDLSRMNRILDFNEKLAYVTIEPGVTLNQLFKFLREKNSGLLVSTTGGSVESSLIGNTLERGVGTGLYAERLSYVCGMEVVLPNGNIIGTGLRRYDEGLSSKTFKWGIGPYVDGIFTQSNLGIVTSLTMWLMPCPEHFQILFYQVDDAAKYYKLVDEVQTMLLTGLVRPTISMFNNYRVISNLHQYPFEHEKEIESGTFSEKTAKLKQYTNSTLAKLWTGEITVRGETKEHADLQSNLIKEKIKDYVDNVIVFEVSKQEMLDILNNEADKPISGEGQELIRNILIRKYLGIPEDNPIRQAYWRKKTPIPADLNPDRDKCGLIWFSPIIPFTGNDLEETVSVIEKVTYEHGLEPAISMQCMSERSIHIIASIAWDREIDGEDERALKCYDRIRKLLEAKGYHYYRENTYALAKTSEREGSYDEFLHDLKQALDPKNILSPGRYIKD